MASPPSPVMIQKIRRVRQVASSIKTQTRNLFARLCIVSSPKCTKVERMWIMCCGLRFQFGWAGTTWKDKGSYTDARISAQKLFRADVATKIELVNIEYQPFLYVYFLRRAMPGIASRFTSLLRESIDFGSFLEYSRGWISWRLAKRRYISQFRS